jgi:hypothetical protein
MIALQDWTDTGRYHALTTIRQRRGWKGDSSAYLYAQRYCENPGNQDPHLTDANRFFCSHHSPAHPSVYANLHLKRGAVKKIPYLSRGKFRDRRRVAA